MKGTTFSTPNTSYRKFTLDALNEDPISLLVPLLQDCVGMMQIVLNTLMQESTNELAGQKNQHHAQFQRWGTNPGSVKINGAKVPIDVPRLKNKETQQIQNLALYQEIKAAQQDQIDRNTLDALLKGLSCRDYDGVVSTVSEHFGLSASSVSRKAKEAATQALETFSKRDLSQYDFVGLLIDGKYLAKQQMVIALGITIEGHKIPIGLIQTGTENHLAIKGLLQDIIGRGFNFTKGLLCVIDGAKGLFKAVSEVFDGYCLIQRCRWHKRENVLSYLNESERPYYRQLLNNAYNMPDYTSAKASLKQIYEDLKPSNASAANSLLEGLEEILCLHKLGLNILFGKAFGTTNSIENVNSLLEKELRNVKYWKDSDQRLRWVASALLDIEPRLRRIPQADELPKLRKALKEHFNIT
jgi:putative transposase